MKNLWILTFFLPASHMLTAQNHQISGTIEKLSNATITLMSQYGDQMQAVDSVKSSNEGSFVLYYDNLPTGMYRLYLGKDAYFDLILNQESVQFSTSGIEDETRISFSHSIENLIFFDYLRAKDQAQFRMELLKPILNQYPEQTRFYKETLAEYDRIQKDMHEQAMQLVELNPGTYASKLIKLDLPPLLDVNKNFDDQRKSLIRNYLNDIDFSDTSLLRTHLFTSKIIGYLGLYQAPGLSQAAQEERFKAATDSILDRAQVNPGMYVFLMEYLISGFEQFGMDAVIQHIAGHRAIDELCEDDPSALELKNRLEMLEKVAVGNKAPNIQIQDIDGHPIDLYGLPNERVVVVFWASWCGHCEEFLPLVYDLYTKGDFEVLAVSLDGSEAAVRKSIEENGFNWINIAELNGWESEIARAYAVQGTPTLFVLDANRNIIARPMNLYDLKRSLNIQ